MKDNNSTTLQNGDIFETADGMILTITNIKVTGLHLKNVQVYVSYDFGNHAEILGHETVSIDNFKANLQG